MVNEEVFKSISSTEYVLEGPRAEVEERVAAIERQFHPLGYGTRLKSSVEKAGVMRAVVWRANSCD